MIYHPIKTTVFSDRFLSEWEAKIIIEDGHNVVSLRRGDWTIFVGPKSFTVVNSETNEVHERIRTLKSATALCAEPAIGARI